jgi:hypothetical protein
MEKTDLPALAEKVQYLHRTDKSAAGAIYLAVKTYFLENPDTAGKYSDWMRSRNLKWEVAKKCAYAHDPGRAAKVFPDSLARNKGKLPAGTSVGELHEAARGFKAMIRKAAISMDGGKGDARKSRDQRTVAFAHFKKLLSTSNLPTLMGMTADEIIELIRTI